jgi:hypothetical protein
MALKCRFSQGAAGAARDQLRENLAQLGDMADKTSEVRGERMLSHRGAELSHYHCYFKTMVLLSQALAVRQDKTRQDSTRLEHAVLLLYSAELPMCFVVLCCAVSCRVVLYYVVLCRDLHCVVSCRVMS